MAWAPKYPWDTVAVGEKFATEIKSSGSVHTLCAHHSEKRAPKVFKTRKLEGVNWVERVK